MGTSAATPSSPGGAPTSGCSVARACGCWCTTVTRWRLLDTPSAWCAGLDACWWWYATDDGLLLEVVSRAPSAPHELSLEVRVVSGQRTSPPGLAPPGPRSRARGRRPRAGRPRPRSVAALLVRRRGGDGRRRVAAPRRGRRRRVAAGDDRHGADPGERPTPGPDTHLGDGLLGRPGRVAHPRPARRRGRGRRRRGHRRRHAVVHPQRPGALPGPARARAVHRRRLGHPRRVPGPGRDCSPPWTGPTRSPTCCCGSSPRRTRAATGPRPSTSCRRCPTTASRSRTATSSSGRCWPSASTC